MIKGSPTHVLKTYGRGVEFRLHLFVAFILDGHEWSDSSSYSLNPGDKPSVFIIAEWDSEPLWIF